VFSLSTTASAHWSEPNPLPIPSPSQPNESRALGLVKGQFLPSQDQEKKGLLLTPEHPFPAKLSSKLRKPPTTEAIWRVWMKTTPHSEGLHFFLRSYVGDEEKKPLDPNHLEQDFFSIRGQLLWWKTQEEQEAHYAVRIAPNDPQRISFPPFLILVYGSLSNPKKGAFWDIQATRQGKRLVVVQAQEVEVQSRRKKPKRAASPSGTVPSKPESSSAQTPPPISPTIMVKGRIPEITVKFNEKIELPSEGKKVSIEVQGENAIRVRAELNRKTLKKQVAKMEEFEDWVGALSGKITQVTPEGVIELEAAGVQVFEKKKKEQPSESNS